MVEILRDKMRDYQADVSGAIRTGQIVQNISEFREIAPGVANVAKGIATIRAKNAAAKQAQQEQADQNIINTEFGKTAHNATMGQLDTLATKYGAGSDRFKTEAYALADKNYAPQIEGMTTEKYKTEMQGRLRQTKDAIDTYQISARAKSIETAKANAAAQKLVNGFGNEAYNQGARQEYGDIQGVNEYIDYVAKKTGQDKDSVRAGVEKDIATSRALGIIDNDPITAARILGDEESLRSYYENLIENDPAYAKLSDSKKEKELEKLLESDKETSNKELEENIVGSSYIDAIEKQYTKGLSEEKVRLQRELSTVNPNSQLGKELKGKISDLSDKIEKVDKGEILDIARKEIKAQLEPELKRSIAEHKQQIKVDRYNTAVSTWGYAMDPDPLTASKAQFNIWATEQGLMDRASTEIGEWDSKTMSKYNPLMSPIKDEVNVEQLASDYQQYVKNSQEVKEQLHPEYQGTMEMHDLLQDLLNDDNGTPIQFIAKAYKAQNAAFKAPITEDQRKTFNNLVAKAVQDKGFGDMVSSVLNNSNRYYPDTSWMANAFGQWKPTPFTATGLPDSIARTDVDAVKTMMEAKTQEVVNNAMHAMVEASSLPAEQQKIAFQQISDQIVAEKRKIFNQAVMNYGIDLEALDNELNTKGRAYTRVGFAIKEYKGRDGSGNPIFSDAPMAEKEAEFKKILEIFGVGNKPQEPQRQDNKKSDYTNDILSALVEGKSTNISEADREEALRKIMSALSKKGE